MIADAYRTGVPMGEVLPPSGGTPAPSFFVTALADPGTSANTGTPLQRIQIVKGWTGDDGQLHERIFEVAGDPENGADVSRETCGRSGEGAVSLCAVWTDPEFDASQAAVYYARAVENPSCRWNAWQCSALDEGRPPGVLCRPRDPVAHPGASVVVAHLVPLGLRLGGVMQLLVLQRVLSRLASSGPPFRPRTGPTGREIDGEAQYSIRVHSGERRAPGINSLHGVTRGRDEHRESTHFTESLEGETSTGNQLTSRSHSRERRAPDNAAWSGYVVERAALVSAQAGR